ncbi:WD40-repeat-containing domain protein [Gymnopilus junonius]|uniref:ASTRA-associated protein 1 n=1 Tax=Gymnopilus junonius TaxID=109634 RepID=A0A9P5TSC9_GYMJU|nr:WD40-repeat-containing domain protein [Gymnopilus junonius]
MSTTAPKRPAPPPPSPLHLLRSHSSPLSALALSDDNERVYSADASGKVVVTSTRSLRALASWIAHTDSILGVEEWDNFIVTHGRDNKLHVWQRVEETPFSARIGSSAGLPNLPTPTLCYSMDVNALNFCRFSLVILSDGTVGNGKSKALIALPNLIDSSTADVWSLPSNDRVHAAIGQETNNPILSANPSGRNTSGIIMSMHLYYYVHNGPSTSSSNKYRNLRLLTAYENGSVVLREYTRTEKEASVEGEGWDILWKSKLHNESIMAMKVSRANDFAVTVSADHIMGRYDLAIDGPPPEEHGIAFRTKHPGNGSIAIRDDGKVCAAGGWDGKIRLYSTKSFKPLGTLKYHKLACQCVEFARACEEGPKVHKGGGLAVDDNESDDEDMTLQEKIERTRWLIAGSKDNRVSIWSLISFEK